MAQPYTHTIPESSTNGDFSLEEAKEMLRKAEEAENEEFLAEIKAVCEKHKRTLTIDARIIPVKLNE